jgi:1,4-dihydroxy-2-naphthoate octaprenyltransferase
MKKMKKTIKMKIKKRYKYMTIGEIMSNVTFLFIGSFGIYAHLKEPNYMLLAGSAGIIFVIISSIVSNKRSNYV